MGPARSAEQVKKDQDDEIFERTRLVNCGFFMQIILRGKSDSFVSFGSLADALDP